MTAALVLQRSGARVAVLEAREVAAAASGNNTAKVTALHGRAYSEIGDPGAAAEYARANEVGLELMGRLARELGIECSWRRAANYTFADDPGELPDLERELEASRGAGLRTELVDETPLPFGIAGAVRLADQAEFDPVAYLRGLADELDRDEQAVFERSRVTEVGADGLTTAAGARLRCERVILATHLPILDHVGLFGRAEPMASFAVTARLPRPAPDGMYIDAKGEHSLRRLRRGDDELLIVGGHGHRLGTGSARASVAALEEYARERFGASEFVHRWDAHDFVTEDRLPFVGAVGPRSDRVLAVTGLNKWGLALGSACAETIAMAIAHGGAAWPREFDSRRLPRPRAWPTLISNGAKTAAHLFGDRLKRPSADRLGLGEGGVVGAGIEQRAAYRDEAGRLHELSARCTHLGCIVAFNDSAKTWDCPCHGSRFAVDGSVLEGPAVKPLKPTV